ncbi:MAG: hypothetical protein WDM77_06505 [Steroidobacteraceae bacterium]
MKAPKPRCATVCGSHWLRPRLRTIGLDPTAIVASQQVFQPDAIVVAGDGEHAGSPGLARFLPFACGILIFIGVMTGGQILMTSTVEEEVQPCH